MTRREGGGAGLGWTSRDRGFLKEVRRGKVRLNYRPNGGRGQLDTEKRGDERGKGK